MVIFSLSQSYAQQFYNVVNYGAKNDSSKIATNAIAAAINAASKKGGGTCDLASPFERSTNHSNKGVRKR